MTKDNLLVLCASLCLSLAASLSAQAATQTPQDETHKVLPARAATDRQAAPAAEKLSGEHGLLADRLEIKKKISNHRRLRDEALRRELEEKELESPSEELYGDESWTMSVNPFAGLSADLPETYDINLDGFVMPIERRQVTSGYGYRSRFRRMHYGTDLALTTGDTIRAAFSGKVRIASYEGRGYGHYIVLRHTNGLETVYGHMSRRLATEGTIVKAGDPIGLGGSTGRSTGPHLHFEARFMGIPLPPHELFDFELGAPKLDVFTFNRSEHANARSHARRSSLAAETKQKASKKEHGVQTHRIKKGETLSSIARKYGTTVKKLQSLNGMSTTKIREGKSLRIS